MVLAATRGLPAPVLGSIPSPSSSQLEIGPLSLTAYGLMIALGVLAAVWLARRRWAERGGDPEDIVTVALWAVPAGLVGARLYHVITDWPKYFPDRPLDAFAIWEGGLGIPGGIALGVAVGVIVARRLGMRLPVGLDVVAPCLPLAQAIGRWGNWFNQELFGRPTDLPWALQIDAVHRPQGFAEFSTFHPTFLYESLWNLALVAALLLIDRRRILRPGNLFVLYVGGYFLGRLWIESLRIDTASLILGIRVNIWMSLVMLAVTAALLAVRGVRRRDDDSDEPYTPAAAARGGPSDEDRTSDDGDDGNGPSRRSTRPGRGSLGGGTDRS